MYYIIFRRSDPKIKAHHIYWGGFYSKEKAMAYYRHYLNYPITYYRMIKIIEIDDNIHRYDDGYNRLFPETHHYDSGEVDYK